MKLNLNPTEVEELRSEWAGVKIMQSRMQNLVRGTFVGASYMGPAIAMVVYNLPLLLAFDVLKQTLAAARDEKLFECPGSNLGVLMDRGKEPLRWIDWDALRKGVLRRNKIAHDGKLFEATECLQDIAGVEAQLIDWGLVDVPEEQQL